MKRNIVLFILILFGITIIALAGYSADSSTFPEVQVITKTEYRWGPAMTVKEIEYVASPPIFITKTVEIEKEVEKIVTVNQTVVVTQNVTQTPQDWQTVEQFKDWCKPFSSRVLFMVDGRPAKCSDYAQDLQRRACCYLQLE